MILIIGAKPVSAENITSSSEIPLTKCLNHFYCISLISPVFRHDISARFDTGASTFIVPKACLNKYKIIHANTLDEWGDPADIVEGDISLTAADGTNYTVPNFQFFATNESTCDENSFINFGAGMNLFFTWDKNFCVDSFFSAYPYHNPQDSSAYGFKIFAKDSTNNTPYITLGNLSSSEYESNEITEFIPVKTQTCGGKTHIKSFVSNTNWGNPTISNVTINIGESNNKINLSNLTAMVDTGAGMTIISDDKSSSLKTKLLESGLGIPCSNAISWLDNCICLIKNQSIQFIWNNQTPVNPGFLYSYSSTNTEDGHFDDLAVCPAWNPNSGNPYILPNGINPGFKLFDSAKSVMFDFNNGRMAISKDKV